MPVTNENDTGTVATVGRPRPTLTIETYALYSSAVAATAFGLELARCGRSPAGLIGFFAALVTFGLLAFDIGRKSPTRRSKTGGGGPALSPDFSAYDFDPFFKLEVGQVEPLPPDFDANCIVVFYNGSGNKVETWITGVPHPDHLIRYVNNPAKNSADDPDHVAVSP